jgi:hypothetical protein
MKHTLFVDILYRNLHVIVLKSAEVFVIILQTSSIYLQIPLLALNWYLDIQKWLNSLINAMCNKHNPVLLLAV